MTIPEPKKNKTRSFRRGTRGAVLVEFIFAFMPLMILYLCMAELVHYFTIREVVMHAANAGARACAVVGEDGQFQPGGKDYNGPASDYKEAVKWALKPWESTQIFQLDQNALKCDIGASATDPYGADTVTVKGTYTCIVPIAKVVICNGGTKTMEVKSSFPHQGAKYKM
jgi:Flp pilus assembly protein TadG